jgi:hypothetical protein
VADDDVNLFANVPPWKAAQDAAIKQGWESGQQRWRDEAEAAFFRLRDRVKAGLVLEYLGPMEFVSTHVWLEMDPEIRALKIGQSLGGLLKKMEKDGHCKLTDERVNLRRKENHGRRQEIWRFT